MNRFYILFSVFVSTFLFGQTNFQVKVSKKDISINEPIKVEFSFVTTERGKITDEKLPVFDHFEVLSSGPIEGSGWNNGISYIQKGYQLILKPTKTGNITIEPASIRFNGKLYKTDQINIKVSESNVNNGVKLAGTFVILEVSNKQPYLNEPIYAELKIYTKNPNIIFSQGNIPIKTPTLKGWTVQTIKKNEPIGVERAVKNGDIYYVASLMQYLFTPNQTGEIEIPPFGLEIEIPDGYWDTQTVLINSPSVEVMVKNLPEANQPENFTGAVGQFSVNFTSDKTEVNANETINFEIEIIGNGNLKMIAPPEIITPLEFEAYPTKERENILATSSGMKGKVVNSQTVVPLYGGEYTIKPQSFAYFDPSEEVYKEINPDPIIVKVDGPPAPDKNILTQQKESIKLKQPQKSYVEPIVKTIKQSSNTWIIILAGLVLAGSFFFLFRYLLKKKQEDENEIMTEKATEKEQKEVFDNSNRISTLKQHLKDNNISEFMTELEIGLKELPKKLSSENIDHLTTHGLEEILRAQKGNEIADKWKNLMTQVQLQKYAPINDNSMSLEDYYNLYDFLNTNI